MTVPAHEQKVTRTYVIAYPEHGPRTTDPHYATFRAYRRLHAATARCQFAIDRTDDSECDHENPLELHHAHLEWAMLNEVDLALLEHRYPGVSSKGVGAWIESGDNLMFLCRRHHRGHGGVHVAASADYEASHFVRNLIS